MSACLLPKLSICVREGATNRIPIRFETDELVWVPIAGLSQTAPLEVITTVPHNCPDDWPVAITGVRRPREINAEMPLKDRAFNRAKRVSAEALQFNKIDGSVLSAYGGGGHIVFYKPFDYAPWPEARMEVKDRVGGNTLAYYSTDDNTLVFDPANDTFWVEPGDTFGFSKGVFDIEFFNSGAVRAMCSVDSEFIVLPEITTGHP